MTGRIRLNSQTIEAAKCERRVLTEIREAIADEFSEFFSGRGWVRHEPGDLIPLHDKTVLFTGSAISTLKPYLGRVPNHGLWIFQRCLRTQNTKILSDDSVFPGWASWFSTIGCLSQSNDLDRLIEDTWDFFVSHLGVSMNRIRVRIWSKHHDLMRFWHDRNLSRILEIDTNTAEYYTHRFGIDHVAGRNLNLAIADVNSGRLRDFGNIIVIERESVPIGAETAFGVETFLSRLLGMSSPIEAALIADIVPVTGPVTMKLADSLSACVVLLRAGIRPVATNRGRVLRRYLQGLSLLRKKIPMSLEVIRSYAEAFEGKSFGGRIVVSTTLYTYLREFETLSSSSLGLRKEQINKTLSHIFRE